MQTVKSKIDIEHRIRSLKAAGRKIGFIPTMGALHDGHLSLARKAKEICDTVVVSVFVNPTQFNDSSDLDKYPRNLELDAKLLAAEAVDIFFAPRATEIYPNGQIKQSFDFGSLMGSMEAENRPGHFDGVATVVSHLFDACIPDMAFFGEKDFQQLQIIRDLVRQQNRPIEIIGCPIVREANGLAMSSRNEQLSPPARSAAGKIFEALKRLRDNVGLKGAKDLKDDFARLIHEIPSSNVEYIKICDQRSLQEVDDLHRLEHLRAFAVVRIEGVRLLDNLSLFA